MKVFENQSVAEKARGRILAAIAASQLLVLTLWFSASAVAPRLQELWNLTGDETAGLTLAVQIGFVAGAVLSSITGLADAIPSRRLFSLGTVLGVTANSALVVLGQDDVAIALGLRFLTGVALAAVYPAGLKVMSGWFTTGRGMALGVLVGALTVGSAAPHLVRGLGFEWQGVVLAASGLAVLGGLIMALLVEDGPHEVTSGRFSFRQVGRVVRNRGVRLATYGYLGHMWELYAMWTWTASFFAASAAAGGQDTAWVSTATFVVIAAGGLGSWLAGRWSDAYGRTLVAGGSMVLSGSVALLSPALFGASPWLLVPAFVVWGVAVVADSAQFSTMVTETAPSQVRGTALTLQTAVGFLLTLVTIRGVPLIADAATWQWAFPVLTIGPALGVIAMIRLRRSPEARLLAGGLG